jgi:TolB-like protein
MADILLNLNKYVQQELAEERIPPDAKYVLVGAVNNDGTRIMAAVKLYEGRRFQTKVQAVWDHDWDGNDTAALKVVFIGK